jgi:pilus assembly protein Flp/PilA
MREWLSRDEPLLRNIGGAMDKDFRNKKLQQNGANFSGTPWYFLGISNSVCQFYSRHIPRDSQGRSAAENKRGETKMIDMKQLLKNLSTEDSGQDLIEYALVAALVGLGAVASITTLKNTIANTFNSVGSSLTNATA